MPGADAQSRSPLASVHLVPDDELQDPTPRRRLTRRQPSVPKPNAGRRLLVGVVFVAFVVFLSARGIARFATNVLWFDSLGYGKVFGTMLFAQVGLGAIFGLFGALAVFLNLAAADRLAPRTVSNAPEDVFVVRYRELMSQRGTRLRLFVAAVFGVMTGLPMASRWREWLLYRNGGSFGVKDPQFGKDVGYYVFKLPFQSFVIDWAFATLIISILITASAHYLNGGIRMQVTGKRVTAQVKTHLSILLALLALLKAAGYWLARYNLMSSTRGVVDGAGYTDVKASLPAIGVLLLISVLAAALLIANVRQKGWRLPVIAVGLWMIVALVAGQVYPAVVQRFTVSPNEGSRERLYIERNIEATKAALGLDEVEIRTFDGSAPPVSMSGADLDNLRRARVIDPIAVSKAFSLLKGNVEDLGVFRFLEGENGGLDVNRATVGGETRQIVSAVRELNPNTGQRSWENRHLAFTHGIGFVVADATETDSSGRPMFIEEPALTPTRPQVYFGEAMTDYAVVRTKVAEVDGTSTKNYEGSGGVSIKSRFRRVLFGLRYGEWNLFASGSFTGDSRILYDRDIVQRAKNLAPYLSFGGDPYAVVSDGRLLWVLDGFTTTDRYPYAQRARSTELSRSSGLANQRFNYVRNSVKIVIDAYEGTTQFFVMDPDDPIVKAYQKAFPSLYQSERDLPGGVRSTMRYPQELLQVQSTAWGTYRLDDPDSFYKRDGAWDVSPAPRRQQERTATTSTTLLPTTTLASDRSLVDEEKVSRVVPYFGYVQLPGEENPEFVSLRSYVPRSQNDDRRELAGFITASSEPASYGRLIVYRVDVLPLPPGPLRVDADTSKIFSEELTKLDQQGSQVTFTDLQLVPLGQSMAWMRSWFLGSNVKNDFPRLNSVTVTVGEQTYRGATLELALAQAFTGASAAPPSTPSGETSVESLLAEADRLYNEAQAALNRQEISFDEYRTKLEAAYAKLAEAATLATGKTVTAGPPEATAGTTETTSVTVKA